jgi:hypothetical protein
MYVHVSKCKNDKIKFKKKRIVINMGCQWLMPVMLAIQELEIRKIMVQSQPK